MTSSDSFLVAATGLERQAGKGRLPETSGLKTSLTLASLLALVEGLSAVTSIRSHVTSMPESHPSTTTALAVLLSTPGFCST